MSGPRSLARGGAVPGTRQLMTPGRPAPAPARTWRLYTRGEVARHAMDVAIPLGGCPIRLQRAMLLMSCNAIQCGELNTKFTYSFSQNPIRHILYMCAIIGHRILDTGLPLLYKTLLTAATVETGELRERLESWRAGDTATSFPTIIEETGARAQQSGTRAFLPSHNYHAFIQ